MLATPELIAAEAQVRRLAEALPRYCEKASLYHGRKRSSGGDTWNPLERWQELPLITKQDIRRNFPHNFLPPGQDLEELLERSALELEHTSGTSEQRTPLLLPWGWWAQQERRAMALNSLVDALLNDEPEARRVTINSPVCSGDICYTGVPSRSDRVVGTALHLSLSRFPFLWGEAELARMARETVEWQPRFLDVDPAYGVVFALYCEKHGIRFPSLRFVLCSYEFLSTVHRRVLRRVFQVPVLNLYGSTETGHLLMEDERGEMKPSLETAFLEIHKPGPDGVGDLVVTTLTNDFMPLIRYRIGDLVQARPQAYQTRYTVHGRAADAFHLCIGRRVTTFQVDACFEAVPGIAHYQLIERCAGPWSLRFVTEGKGPEASELRALQGTLTDLLCLSEPPELRPADMLVPESSGKFRLGYPRASV